MGVSEAMREVGRRKANDKAALVEIFSAWRRSRVMRHSTLLKSFAVALLLAANCTEAAEPSKADIVVASVDGHELKLDLYLPKDVKKPPLVVFIHGGSWRANSYKNCQTPWLTDHGFAVASISYRLSQVAVFPAQIHDCKAAVRWLRAHANEYGYDATRIGVAGTSAGGHLALLLGTTGGVTEYEGAVGGNLDQSSTVQAVVDYYGPTDFIQRSQNQPAKTEKENSPVWQLIGGPVKQNQERARFASPAFQVSEGDAPLLILHGDKDTTVYLDQSQRIERAYQEAGLEVTFQLVPGGKHGGDAHFTPERRELVAQFLKKHLSPTMP
jgi:acetyl esterase/lipase